MLLRGGLREAACPIVDVAIGDGVDVVIMSKAPGDWDPGWCSGDSSMLSDSNVAMQNALSEVCMRSESSKIRRRKFRSVEKVVGR